MKKKQVFLGTVENRAPSMQELQDPSRIRTVPKVHLGGRNGGESVGYAVILFGQNADRTDNYYGPTNDTHGTSSQSQMIKSMSLLVNPNASSSSNQGHSYSRSSYSTGNALSSPHMPNLRSYCNFVFRLIVSTDPIPNDLCKVI